MARTLKISVQEYVPEFVQLAKRGKSNLILSHTIAALEQLSLFYMETWIDAASGMAHLPGLPFMINSKQYQNTIRRRQISPTVWEVYSDYTTKTGLGVTDLLEKGHGLIDLKPGLLRGPKSRQGSGGRYNIVSFRHGDPTSDVRRNNPMPMSVYKTFTQTVKKIDAQRAAGASPIPGTSYTSISSTKPGDRSYLWGARYDQKSQEGRRSKIVQKKIKRGKNKGAQKRVGETTWKSGKYAGMVRLQESTTKSQRGGYFTFRVVSWRSDPMSWIVPEQDPWPVRKAVIEKMRPMAEAMLQEALKDDIQ